MSEPSPNDTADFLLSCRYGDLDDITLFIDRFGPTVIPDIRDDNDNTPLHMIAANGHTDVLTYLLPLLPPSLLSAKNTSGSTPLHWAALNAHLPIAQALIAHSPGPGVDLIDIKNNAGRSPLGEAEMAGWEEGARWFVEVMNLDDSKGSDHRGDGDGDGDGDNDDGQDAPIDPSQSIHLEIEDADGQIANLTINDPPRHPAPPAPHTKAL